jgi:LuxR family maltose regulon positive regulatory protein
MGAASAGSAEATRSRALRPSELPFELLESKLRPPRLSDQSVPRTSLVERLNRPAGPPIVLVCAGPGYGKTTAIAQWVASREDRPFAWVSVDDHDNDPVVLLTYVAVALDRISPIDPGVFESLASPGASIEPNVVPRLGVALANTSGAFVIVLDDVHAIENLQCIDVIVALALHLADGSQLALLTRDHSACRLDSCGRALSACSSDPTTCAWGRTRRESS